ncbi:hypothetical protein HGA10_06805 [Nocardia coubleae]|uniref:Uncharacterized protein n=2 Tax=Nocardia coubleae TaxID=356147 RepID=A0A846W1L5_9NOCA|nr:hypothetical protein [Nocardia coubleae]
MTGRADSEAELFRRDPRPPDFIEHRRYASFQAWRQLVVGGHIDHEQLVGDLLGISRYVHSRYAYGYTIHEVLPEFSRSRLSAALGDVIVRLPMEPAVRIPVEEAVIRLVAFFGPVPMELLSDSVLRTVFSGIRPRDVEFAGSTDSLAALDKISATDTRRLSHVLCDVPDAQLLCMARLRRPDLLEAVHAAFDSTDGAWAVSTYLARDFPPPVDIPTPDSPRMLAGLVTLAEGMPGDTVSHGLFPSPITKLARLCLASTGHYPPAHVLDAARSAYDRRRPYYAHDAVACALAHPEISAAERADLIRHLSGHDSHGRAAHGRRARKKFWRIARWAAVSSDSTAAG